MDLDVRKKLKRSFRSIGIIFVSHFGNNLWLESHAELRRPTSRTMKAGKLKALLRHARIADARHRHMDKAKAVGDDVWLRCRTRAGKRIEVIGPPIIILLIEAHLSLPVQPRMRFHEVHRAKPDRRLMPYAYQPDSLQDGSRVSRRFPSCYL